MASTVTYDFKNDLIEFIGSDIQDSSSFYYIGFGRSQDWEDSDGLGSVIPEPATNSLRSTRRLKQNLQSIKQINDYEFVVPRYNWSNGSVYNGYDDDVAGNLQSNSYYVMTQDNGVYICLQQGRDIVGNPVASTVQPSGTNNFAFKTSDGYVWKFLYNVGSGLANKYLSANFIPVTFVESVDSASPATIVEQKGIQDAATPGEVIGVEVTDGGSGYSTAPTVTIKGDGTGVSAKAFVSSGSVTKVEILDSDGLGNTGMQFGNGYTKATVEFDGVGTGAAGRVILASPGGIGANPRVDLRSTSAMFNVKTDGDENGDFVTTNDFRQVSILKNPNIFDSDATFTDATGDALSKLRIDLSTYTGTISPDILINQVSTGAVAYVDKFDSDTIWYHQTEETGFTPFVPAQQITYSGGSVTLEADSATALLPPEIDVNPARVLYYDNRAAVSRSSEQTEDIKVVIQL